MPRAGPGPGPGPWLGTVGAGLTALVLGTVLAVAVLGLGGGSLPGQAVAADAPRDGGGAGGSAAGEGWHPHLPWQGPHEHPQGQDQGQDQQAGAEDRGPLDISVQTHDAGKLRLQIGARVSVNAQPLGQAEVVAYTDMVEMPGAHGQGPLRLQELPTDPGLYMTEARLPMPGSYQVRVQVRSPIPGEQTVTAPVGVVDSSSG